MFDALETFANRERGAFPVSIGTSLALESAAGIYPEKPEPNPPIRKVEEVWFNLRTIIRNLLGAIPTDARDRILPADAVAPLIEDLSIIKEVVHDISKMKTKAVFYHCDYKYLKRLFPKATLKEPTTAKQKQAHAVEEEIIRLFLENTHGVKIVEFKGRIEGSYPTSFIVTHLPVDLLARYRFRQLTLLESHSGNLKPYGKWHTKLTGGKELEFIPFNEFSIQVFGDNNNHFSAQLPSLKKVVVDLAVKDHWTALTTDDKIRASIKKLEDKEIRDQLLEYL